MASLFSLLRTPAHWFGAAVCLLTALRVAGLAASPTDLHFDEAQYWSWSRDFAFGYFSKPPLIAWAIGLTTSVFGHGEWAVRLAAPLAHAAGATALFLLARRIYSARAGLWAGLGWLLLPGVWLSSGVISTDALLLPIWAWGLYALWRLIEAPTWRWALGLGVLIGVGALAKYAMLYFFLCLGLAALAAPKVRSVLLSRNGALVAGAALLVLSPNLFWNAQNGFATIGHTAANANLSAGLFHPDEMLEFLASQAGVVGPVFFVVLSGLFVIAARRPAALQDPDKLLLSFILVPLAIITVQALLSRAHANWAAAAYPAAMVWIAGRLSDTRTGRRTLLGANALNGALGLVFLTAATSPAIADRIGMADAFKRTRGWEETCAVVQTQIQAAPAPFSAILVDHRALFFALRYYCGPERITGASPPLRMWVLRGEPANHAAATAAMTPQDGANVLVVQMAPGYQPLILGDFSQARHIQTARIDLGGGNVRWLVLSHASGFAPAARDADFLARIEAIEANGPVDRIAPAQAPTPSQ